MNTISPRTKAVSNALGLFFSPRSVAVIGATDKPGSVGRAVMENLAGFGDHVFPVNLKRTEVLGRRAYASITALPERPDLAVIITPATTVPGVIRECAAAGVAAAVVLSAGFKETGPEGAGLERDVLAEARRGGVRLIGPNCLGVMSPRAKFNATFAAGMARPGSVAFISQSGALCTAILDWSFRENVGFSAFVSIGSMLDVGWGDVIDHFGDDPHTRSIVCYMESVGDARRFLSAAREVALAKPVIVLKVGRTEAAAKAAASHTGALTGSDDVLDAAFRRVGVLRVETIDELFNMAEILAKQPRPLGPRLAIVTNAGGPGALSTDMLLRSGGQLAPLSADTVSSLNGLLPPHWSHGNPIDILGDAAADRYMRTVEIVREDPLNDGLLVILTPQKMTESTATAEKLRPFARLDGKPLLASWMGGQQIEAGEALLNEASIPTFRSPDQAARAFALMWQYSDNLRSIYETPALTPVLGSHAAAGEIIDRVRQKGRELLTEAESKQLLTAYGIPVVETHVAHGEDEAVARAERLGFPVVLKLYSETVTHKTEAGGVQLNIRTASGVRQAWNDIRSSCAEKAGAEAFLGVTVQPMAPLDGCELILGSSTDPQFGPVLLFGMGGRLVEVFKDRALGLPPLNATLARRLMEQTKVYAVLKGVRGREPVDLAALEQLLVRFSHLVVEQRWISEIDINPLLASPDGLLALDARVVLHPSALAVQHLPRSAIRPYPAQHVSSWIMKNGMPVTIRPIRPEDEPLILKFHGTLGEQSVYQRYFGRIRLEQRIAHERLARVCFIDYDREMALVAERRETPSGSPEILGVGRLSRLHGANESEFALIVADQWQGLGLGTHLLCSLVQIGREERLDRITGVLMSDNLKMQAVARRAGFHLTRAPHGVELVAELDLTKS